MRTNNQRPLVFGEVLFDCFENGNSVMGGAPFNVAWNLHAFGENPLFISRIGQDALGQKIMDVLEQHGFDTAGIQVDEEYPTGAVGVHLNNHEASYDIRPDQAYDFIDSNALPELADVGLIYHGTLGIRNSVSNKALVDIKQQTNAPVFVDINLRKPWDEGVDIDGLIQQAAWCKLNEEEFKELSPCLLGSPVDLKDRFKNKVDMFSNNSLGTLFVTKGASGAIALRRNEPELQVTPVRSVDVTDTVGAGDAFCSVLILGLLRNWDLKTILERAQSFASAVVGIRGATTTDGDFYDQFKKSWEL
ncbi:MAG: PfkB family carbohydrate kinase [Neptuniibacter sp.]